MAVVRVVVQAAEDAAEEKDCSGGKECKSGKRSVRSGTRRPSSLDLCSTQRVCKTLRNTLAHLRNEPEPSMASAALRAVVA